MEEKQAGVTALVTAYFRAYHAENCDPKIFDDFLAMKLFSAEEQAFFMKSLSGMLPITNPEPDGGSPDPATALAKATEKFAPTTLCRSRYTEDCLRETVKLGLRQYVILGAGMDSFAFRKPEWAAGVQVFELDHPVTQQMKRERLASLGWAQPEQLHFVPVDFTKQDLAQALKESTYDLNQPGFFSWLGVTYYLPKEAAWATIESVSKLAARGSSLVFDYMNAQAFDPQSITPQNQTLQWIVRQSGEPMKTGFTPVELAGGLQELGFDLLEDLDADEIEKRYFQGRRDGYHAPEQVHLARAVVRQVR
jgi:methyltransferase (TIGR00027 family)